MASAPRESLLSESEPAFRQNKVRARLRIRPHDGHTCSLNNCCEKCIVTSHDIVCRNGVCECRAFVETESGTELVGKRIEDGCICPVFWRHDCISTIESFEHGEIVVRLSAPSREALSDLIDDIEAQEAVIQVRKIATENPLAEQRRLALDVKSITDKQREAIKVAVEAGYYETPRRATLQDLADYLDVSRSAVSQRLNGAESTLIRALYDREISKD